MVWPLCVATVIIAPEPADECDTAVEVADELDAIEYDGLWLYDGSLLTTKPVRPGPFLLGSRLSSSGCGRGTASGVPFTDRTDSLYLACRRGYVGVLGGRTGLKPVVGGLNCAVVVVFVECLTGDAGLDLKGETSRGWGLAPGRIVVLEAAGTLFRVGVLGKSARGLEGLGPAFAGDAGCKRAIGR